MLPRRPDTDDDGLPDGAEDNTGVYVSPAQTGTDPLDPDTDGDRFDDGWEVALGSNPHDPNDPHSRDLPRSAPGPRRCYSSCSRRRVRAGCGCGAGELDAQRRTGSKRRRSLIRMGVGAGRG